MNRYLVASVVLSSISPAFLACSKDTGSDIDTVVPQASSSPVVAATASQRFPGGGGGGGTGMTGGRPQSTAVGAIDPSGGCPSTAPAENSTCSLGSFTTCDYDRKNQCQCSERGGKRTWDCFSADNSCPTMKPATGGPCTNVIVVCNYSAAAAQCGCRADADGKLAWDCGDGAPVSPVPTSADGGSSDDTGTGTLPVSDASTSSSALVVDAAAPAQTETSVIPPDPDTSVPPDQPDVAVPPTEPDTSVPVELDAGTTAPLDASLTDSN